MIINIGKKALSVPYISVKPMSESGNSKIMKEMRIVEINVSKALLSPDIFRTPNKTISNITGTVAAITNFQKISVLGFNEIYKTKEFKIEVIIAQC